MSKLLDDILGAGGSGAVSSVFGRTGAVLAAPGDYGSTLIANQSGVSGATVTDALNALASGSFSPGSHAGQPLVWNGTAYAAADIVDLHSTANNARLAGGASGLTIKGGSATLTIQSNFAFSSANLGFFGATPTPQPAPNSFANLVVALKNLGLINTSSTAPIAGSDIANGAITATQISASAAITGSQLAAAAGILGAQIGNNEIGNAQLRQGAACSVVGRSANSLGNLADIAAGADNTVFQRAGGALVFAALPLTAIANQATKTVLMNATGGNAPPTACTLGPGVDAVSGALQIKGAPSGKGATLMASSTTGWDFTGLEWGTNITASGNVIRAGGCAYEIASGALSGNITLTFLTTGTPAPVNGFCFVIFIYDTSANTIAFRNGPTSTDFQVRAGSGVPEAWVIRYDGANYSTAAVLQLRAKASA